MSISTDVSDLKQLVKQWELLTSKCEQTALEKKKKKDDDEKRKKTNKH